MNEGFYVNGAHSYGTHGLRCLKREISEPKKDEYLERVPYSNIVYDFGGLYGEQTYGERKLSYTFDFICFHRKKAQDKLMNIKQWLKWRGSEIFYDDLIPDYHFRVREPSISWSEKHGVYTVSVTFPAAPEMWQNSNKLPNVTANLVFPDINGDGVVDAHDASTIIAAYTALMTGRDPGLTNEQLDACDADRNGVIDAADASLVLQFYALTMAGRYKPTPEGWKEFMGDRENEVI